MEKDSAEEVPVKKTPKRSRKGSKKGKKSNGKEERDTLDDIDDADFDISDEEPEKKGKGSWMYRKKKGMASAAASSSLGKQLIYKFVDKETLDLLNTVKIMVGRENNPKFAKTLKKDIIKIAVKVLMLYEDKKLTDDSFNSLVSGFRRICASVRNGYKTNTLKGKRVERVSELIGEFSIGIRKILTGLISPKTDKRIESICLYISDVKFLNTVIAYPEFDKIACTLAYYLEEMKKYQ
mmetsp:Transcript_27601/g.30731  ORF Transcript_27601/g.30731 Transcript_27601/m.30731 type:complete len:237 (+) Transcript_27601:70-780(+)